MGVDRGDTTLAHLGAHEGVVLGIRPLDEDAARVNIVACRDIVGGVCRGCAIDASLGAHANMFLVVGALSEINHMYYPNGVGVFLLLVRDVRPRGIFVLEVVVLRDVDIGLGEFSFVPYLKVRPVPNRRTLLGGMGVGSMVRA